jgi:hypothetical protein
MALKPDNDRVKSGLVERVGSYQENGTTTVVIKLYSDSALYEASPWSAYALNSACLVREGDRVEFEISPTSRFKINITKLKVMNLTGSPE